VRVTAIAGLPPMMQDSTARVTDIATLKRYRQSGRLL